MSLALAALFAASAGPLPIAPTGHGALPAAPRTGAALPSLTTPWATGSTVAPDWFQVGGAGAPPARSDALFVFDASDAFGLLFGGLAANGSDLGDSWALADGNWSPLAPGAGPSPRFDAAGCYDASDGYVLLFGGISAAGTLGDSWTFHAGRWTNITGRLSQAPPPRGAGTSVYDAADGYCLLAGGESPLGVLYADSWSFRHGNWSYLGSNRTAPTYESAAVYDPLGGYVLVFGGISAQLSGHNQTWKFVGGKWSELSPSVTPPPRDEEALGWDALDSEVVMTEGLTANGSSYVYYNDTWLWNGSDWRSYRPPHQPPQAGWMSEAMPYDPNAGYPVFFGPTNPNPTNETWAFAPGPRYPVRLHVQPAIAGAVRLASSEYADGTTAHLSNGSYALAGTPTSGYLFWKSSAAPPLTLSAGTLYVSGAGGDVTVSFRPEFRVEFLATPSGCGSILLNGTSYRNGSVADLLASNYTASASCPPPPSPPSGCLYAFSAWITTGGLAVSSRSANPTNVTLRANGSLKAQFVPAPPGCGTGQTAGGASTDWDWALALGTGAATVAGLLVGFVARRRRSTGSELPPPGVLE